MKFQFFIFFIRHKLNFVKNIFSINGSLPYFKTCNCSGVKFVKLIKLKFYKLLFPVDFPDTCNKFSSGRQVIKAWINSKMERYIVTVTRVVHRNL